MNTCLLVQTRVRHKRLRQVKSTYAIRVIIVYANFGHRLPREIVRKGYAREGGRAHHCEVMGIQTISWSAGVFWSASTFWGGIARTVRRLVRRTRNHTG